MSTQSGKDVLYIDVDDEITAVIDKVRGSGERIVALVLPKRATVLQSIVNMKLLKRTADEAKKHLVLITSETSLLPLAGNVGLHVAKSLQSKPEIPPGMGMHAADIDEEEAVDMADAALDPQKTVGEHLHNGAGSAIRPDLQDDDEDESVELDNTTSEPSVAGDEAAPSKKAGKKSKKFKIPDFNKFKLGIVAAVVLLVVLIGGWWLCFVILPSASVDVKTDSMALQANTDLTLNSSNSQLNVGAGQVPAVSAQTQKVATQQVPATGQKDNGTKASGQVVLSLKDCSQDQVTVPAGTGVTTNNLTFITQQSATLQSVRIGNQCKNNLQPSASSATVNVTSQDNGDKYNVASGASYTVVGFSNVGGSGSAMTGGTSVIVKVVSQADVDGAKQKIASADTTAIQQELQQKLASQNQFVITATFNPGTPTVTTSANVGDQADGVTVTQTTTYTMLGVQQSNLKSIIDNAIKGKIDPSKQKILDYGLGGATFKLTGQQGSTASVSMNDTAITGSVIDLGAVKKQIAGKKAGDAKQIIQGYPGVTDVTVHYSPFWVSAIPSNVNKITVTVEKPTVKQ